jgi:hypothetical protein
MHWHCRLSAAASTSCAGSDSLPAQHGMVRHSAVHHMAVLTFFLWCVADNLIVDCSAAADHGSPRRQSCHPSTQPSCNHAAGALHISTTLPLCPTATQHHCTALCTPPGAGAGFAIGSCVRNSGCTARLVNPLLCLPSLCQYRAGCCLLCVQEAYQPRVMFGEALLSAVNMGQMLYAADDGDSAEQLRTKVRHSDTAALDTGLAPCICLMIIWPSLTADSQHIRS